MKKSLLFIIIFTVLFILTGCEDNSTETDEIPPEVVITNPVNNAEIEAGQIVTIIAVASDNTEIEKVEFKINDELKFEDEEEPYQYEWDTSGLNGDQSLSAKAWDTSGNTGLSDVINVNIIAVVDNAPPNEPYDPTPSDNADSVFINTSLSWSCSDPDDDALTYDVYWGTEPTPDDGELVSEGQTDSSYNPGTMQYETTYYWKIIASDGEYETAGDVWSFTTESEEPVNQPPDEPDNPDPSDNADDVSIDSDLSWTGSDPDDDALTYDVYWGTDITPGNGELVSEGQTDTSYNPGTMQYETTYYWKIIASDGEYETESDIWGFTTIEEVNYGEMVFVQGGTFEMGDHFNEGGNDELPVHYVTLSSYYIGKYEVTQGEYESVMGSNPAHDYGTGDNYPVYNVSWYDAVEFCNALSEQEGLTPCYNLSDWSCDFGVDGYRLPTEAEWEYAARGGINWVDDYRYSGTTDNLGDYAWFGSNSGDQTHEVGTKFPNQLDIYDMSGNVFEWCNDWYSMSYYGSSPEDNPTGPLSGYLRVRRGGSWYYIAGYCCAAYRTYSSPGNSNYDRGFRLCRAAE